MNRINILYLIATLDVGGAERQLVELVKRLDRNKFNPIVCCLTRGGPLEDELKETKIKYFILGKKFKFDFSVIFKLIPILKQKNIHILHTWLFTSNSLGRIAGLVAKTPIIVTSERGVDVWKNKMYLLLDWFLAHFTDKIVCVSEGVNIFYQKYAGIPLDKLVTIYGGVEGVEKVNVSIDGKKKEFGFKKNSTVITTVGHLIYYKGIKYLLFSIPKIVREFPTARFLIVGEGIEENKLKKLAGKLNIRENIIFAGLRKDIKEILSITDIFVLPSLIEGLSNAVMEAMLAEKPVVATHIPGNDELVVDGKTGILVPPRDTDSLASAIINILGNPEEGKKMGINGRKRVKKYFSIDETVRKTEELYENLVRLKIHKEQNG
jgi:glycosyltransferase involved in cell wall biosynthesis